MENVLVTEVFGARDLLPRGAFLGSPLRSAHGADPARMAAAGVEKARLDVLVLDMPDATVLVEAKRIRAGAFQPEQLAREYLCLVRDFRGLPGF